MNDAEKLNSDIGWNCKIVGKMTRNKAIKLFKAHWKWLSELENCSEPKENWPIPNECFACEYARKENSEAIDCTKCFIQWDQCEECDHCIEEDDCQCECQNSAYGKWFRSRFRF